MKFNKMARFKTFKGDKGFTIIEIIVAIFVLTVGIIAAYIAVQSPLHYANVYKDQLFASYLAQEGVELVRNIRDTDWLQGFAPDDWKVGLVASAGFTGCDPVSGYFCELGYDDTALLSYPNASLGHKLKIDSENFYNYNTGELTNFRRKITIAAENYDSEERLRVTVSVFQGDSISPLVTVEESLYNWYKTE